MDSQSMEFQDKEIVCIDCSSPFTFTVDEQSFYQEKGLTHDPKRCKPCRTARKMETRARRSSLFDDGGSDGQGAARSGGQRGGGPGGGPGFSRGPGAGGRPVSSRGPGGGGRPGFSRGPGGGGHPGFSRGPGGGGHPGFSRGPGGGSRPGSGRGREGQPHRIGEAPLFKADFGPTPWEHGGRRQGGGRGFQGAAPQGQRFEAVCADCNTATQVPFRPNGVKPVYCRTCLPRHKARGGRGRDRS